MSEALAYPACCTDCPCPGTTIPLPPSSCPCSVILEYTVELARGFNPATISLPAELHTEGGATAGDSYGKVFRWVADSFAVDDGTPYTTVIKPVTIDIAQSGRWEQTSLG